MHIFINNIERFKVHIQAVRDGYDNCTCLTTITQPFKTFSLFLPNLMLESNRMIQNLMQ